MRSTEVCDAMESQVRIAVNVLSEQDSWSLIREKAGGIEDTHSLNDLAWKVAKECGGLPLAIVTLGRALRNKDELVWENALLELQKNLKKLVVNDCQELQEVFNSEGLVEEHAVLTNLRTLWLKKLPKLSSIWKGAIPTSSLHNLETLTFENCGLRYIFSPTFLEFATRLANLWIKDCEKMENLIMEENFPSQLLAIGHFQNLNQLIIHKCHGFKSLLSSSSAQELKCLLLLEVHSCDGMEVIVRKGEEVADKGVLPQLKESIPILFTQAYQFL
ncbi:hypothetical protein AAC387_Pa10g0533 [Persea americana]